MPQYFFHLRGEHEAVLDREGLDCANLAVVAKDVLRTARSLISHDALDGTIRLDWRIEVEDSANQVVHELSFKDAVAIVGL